VSRKGGMTNMLARANIQLEGNIILELMIVEIFQKQLLK